MKESSYSFDEINIRRGTGCVKWDEDKDGVIPLWVADMDFKTAPCIIRTLEDRVRQGIFGYTHIGEEYYEAIRSWFGSRHGLKLKREWIIYTSGVVPAMSAVIQALTKPGDKVLIQTPVYNCFFSSIRNSRCIIEENPLVKTDTDRNGGRFIGDFTYKIDFADLEEKVRGSRLFILCNPHNPVGRVWTRNELQMIGKICLKYGVPVISDEIHCEIVSDGYEYTPMASLSEEFCRNTITLCSPSKAFNIAGLQIANIIAERKDWRDAINRQININETCDVGPFGVAALQTAYTDPEAAEWLGDLNKYIGENFSFLKEIFAAQLPWIPVASLEGTYLVWCDCRSLGLSSEKIFNTLLDNFSVHVNAGSMYGEKAGEGYIRINLATQRNRLAEGLRRVVEGLNYLGTKQ